MRVSLWIAGALVIVAGGWVALRNMRRLDARVRAHLARNPPLTPTGFAQAYFDAEKAGIASRVHRVFIEIAPIDMSRVHADDNIVEELRLDDLDSMATVELVLAVEKEFEIKLPDAELAKARTLRDLVDLVARHLAPDRN